MYMVYIKSLGIEYMGGVLVSDVDDCLIHTSRSISRLGLDKRTFFYDDLIYERYKRQVFENVELTSWGKEFIRLVEGGLLVDYKLLTAAKNRIDILLRIFPISRDRIIENIPDSRKVKILNNVDRECIYVDDKQSVTRRIDNAYITTINYPSG